MLAKRVFAATLMITALAGALWADLYYFQDSMLLHSVFLVGTYFSFREFWPLCRATGHQTFSVWGTWSGCGLVVVHYVCMHWLSTAGTQSDATRAWNLMNGALAVSFLGTFLLTA